jgi:DNA primase
MVEVLDRLAEPANLRKLLAAFIVLVVVAIALGTYATLHERKTARRVNDVTVQLSTPLTKAQVAQRLAGAIRQLSPAQSRTLLWKQLKAMSPVQRQYLRVLLKRPMKRRKPRAARAPARAPAPVVPQRTPSVLRSEPPVPLPPAPVALPAPAPVVAIPPPAVAPAPLRPEKPGRRVGQQGGKPGKGKGRGRP